MLHEIIYSSKELTPTLFYENLTEILSLNYQPRYLVCLFWIDKGLETETAELGSILNYFAIESVRYSLFVGINYIWLVKLL